MAEIQEVEHPPEGIVIKGKKEKEEGSTRELNNENEVQNTLNQSILEKPLPVEEAPESATRNIIGSEKIAEKAVVEAEKVLPDLPVHDAEARGVKKAKKVTAARGGAKKKQLITQPGPKSEPALPLNDFRKEFDGWFQESLKSLETKLADSNVVTGDLLRRIDMMSQVQNNMTTQLEEYKKAVDAARPTTAYSGKIPVSGQEVPSDNEEWLGSPKNVDWKQHEERMDFLQKHAKRTLPPSEMTFEAAPAQKFKKRKQNYYITAPADIVTHF